MKLAKVLFLLFVLATLVHGQEIKLTGIIYDPNGAVVSLADVKAIDKEGRSFRAKSNNEGSFLLELVPDLYTIEIDASGFRKLKYQEFRVVKSTFGKMNIDFVIFGSTDHEPCGYSGGDCLALPVGKVAKNDNSTNLTGVLTDQFGGIIQRAKIRFSGKKNQEFLSETNEEGIYQIKLP